MKIAPILAQLRNYHGVEQVLVHTGQHYDAKMSGVFFEELGMPEPDVHLGVGSGTHAQQTARVMIEIEPVLEGEKPDVTVLAGDVNSTLAAAPMRRPRRRLCRLRRLRSRLF
jgi:UDP-N-acetylglucosamine 2-epimerase (non-hydrolysing)